MQNGKNLEEWIRVLLVIFRFWFRLNPLAQIMENVKSAYMTKTLNLT